MANINSDALLVFAAPSMSVMPHKLYYAQITFALCEDDDIVEGCLLRLWSIRHVH